MSYVIRAQREDDPEWYYIRRYGGNSWHLTSIKDFATRWVSEDGAKKGLVLAPAEVKHSAKIEALEPLAEGE